MISPLIWVQGIFAYHKEESLKGETPGKHRWWLIIFSVLCATIYTFFNAASMLTTIGYIPNSCVVKGSEIPSHQSSKFH